MDYLATLLDALGGEGFAQASRIDPGPQYALVLDENVMATLSTSEDQEYCLLTAALAERLEPRPDAGVDPWLHDAADPDQPRTFDQLALDHTTGRITLQRCLNRSALDRAGLEAELSRFVQRYRGWQSMLSLLLPAPHAIGATLRQR